MTMPKTHPVPTAQFNFDDAKRKAGAYAQRSERIRQRAYQVLSGEPSADEARNATKELAMAEGYDYAVGDLYEASTAHPNPALRALELITRGSTATTARTGTMVHRARQEAYRQALGEIFIAGGGLPNKEDLK